MARIFSTLGSPLSRRGFALLAFAGLCVAVTVQAPAKTGSVPGGTAIAWRDVDAGLQLAEIDSPVKSAVGDSTITVLRIDLAQYDLRLLSAKELDGRRMPIRQWAKQHGLVAAINAGMYQEDGRTSVGYMRNFAHVNNGHVNPNRAVLAFNRKDDGVPAAQIIDRTCQDFDTLRKRYESLVQSIRMVSCDQKNVWNPQPRSWSMAAIAVDKAGHVLFVMTRSPYSVHDFINILLALPLDIHNAMYLEGGPKASLYVAANGTEIEKIGRFETIFLESDSNAPALPLPNVIGVVPRRRQ